MRYTDRMSEKMSKAIIQRQLPLNVRYTVIDKKYISLIDGFGCTCDNCGKLIANIATVKSNNGVYNIGFDCLETFLLNNNLLDGFTAENLSNVRHNINAALRFSKQIKETIERSKGANITGLRFEKPTYESDWITFYYLCNGETKSRNNSNFKAKNIDREFFIETVKNISPNLQVVSDER